jgi:hypothetical protein
MVAQKIRLLAAEAQDTFGLLLYRMEAAMHK